jgi:hypothetical protein
MTKSLSLGWYGPKHGPWDWILGHFRDVSILKERNVEAWAATQSPLLVAVESRFSRELQFAKSIEQIVAPKEVNSRPLPWCVVLGDDWVGHRRTFPLPETWLTFYWYELYDRLMPWLTNHAWMDPVPSSHDSAAAGKRKVNPRVQRLIDTSIAVDQRIAKAVANPIKLALVVTETSTTRQMWCDTFSKLEIQCVATTPNQFELWITPEIVVVDLESQPLAIREADFLTGIVHKLANQYPSAVILVTDGFPRWDHWSLLLESGADLLVAKPFQLTGVFDTLMGCRKPV